MIPEVLTVTGELPDVAMVLPAAFFHVLPVEVQVQVGIVVRSRTTIAPLSSE